MKIGRNDPCPCGSGKKYKKCCMELDRIAGTTAAGRRRPSEARRDLAAEVEWQADVAAFPARVEDDPAARLGVLLVVAAESGLVIHMDVLDHPSPEVEAFAETLAAGFAAAAERTGAAPRRLRVRHPELVPALAARLAEPPGTGGPTEVVHGPLPALDEAAFAAARQTSGVAGRYLLAAPDTWAGWDLPEDLVARLFRAAARFWRAVPWRLLENEDLLLATLPSGRTWTVCTLGNGGEVYGCNLFSEPTDFWKMVGRDGTKAFDDLTGRVICLHLDPGSEVGRAAVREATAAGWEVADSRAYPRLLAINSPAAGVPLADARDLLAVLEAVPRFVAANAEAIEEMCPVVGWKDGPTGVLLSYGTGPGPGWTYERLAPGDAQGPGAEPEAALAPRPSTEEEAESFRRGEQRFVDRFVAHAGGRARLSAAAAELEDAVHLFVDFLAGCQGIPVRAVHEYDLRTFLYDWYPRKVVDTGEAAEEGRAVPGSLERFFEYLASEEKIECPWAKGILDDEREVFETVLEASVDPEDDDEGAPEAGPGSYQDMLDRLLVPDFHLGEDDTWGLLQGITEAGLADELQRRWLLWRDELIRAGTDRPGALATALFERQYEWETTPHPALGGKTPVEAIQAERREREKRAGRRKAKRPRRGFGKGRKRSGKG